RTLEQNHPIIHRLVSPVRNEKSSGFSDSCPGCFRYSGLRLCCLSWSLPMVDRREFFQRAAVGAAFFGLPLARAEQVFGQEVPPLPSNKLLATDPDRFWAELRRQWLLAADRINLNCGSVGCTPPPVLHAMIVHLLSAEAFR